MELFLLPVGLLAILLLLYFLRYGRRLVALWQEPVLRYPVVIFESDDWGPAETFEAERLKGIMRTLSEFQDVAGRHPVMTLGVVLSVADTSRIREAQGATYYALGLDDQRFEPIRKAMNSGVSQGLFALQLHGMAHYLPETLLEAAKNDIRVRHWLTGEGIPDPYDLPTALQSRWTDGSRLPSMELDADVTARWAEEEARRFGQIFGMAPEVAVPPTFIWNRAVEEGWVQAGVRYVVTPGRRHFGRDREANPIATGSVICNGQPGMTPGIHYLVRNNYFEPRLGHTASRAIKEARRQTRMGRPTLFETHRFNFNGTQEAFEAALWELSSAIEGILEQLPETRFLGTAELGDAIVSKDPRWIEVGLMARMAVFLRRTGSEMPLIRRWCAVW